MSRYLLINTPNYINKDYVKARDMFDKNSLEFKKRFVKKKAVLGKPFSIELIGFDGKIKKRYSKMSVRKIFADIDSMPMGYVRAFMKKGYP